MLVDCQSVEIPCRVPLHRQMADMWCRGDTKLILALLCVDMEFWSRMATSLQNVTGQSSTPEQGPLRMLATRRPLACLTPAREAFILCNSAPCRTERAPAAVRSTDKSTSRFRLESTSGSAGWRLMRWTSPRRAPAALRTAFWTLRQ